MEIIDVDAIPEPEIHCSQCGAKLLGEVCDTCHICHCSVCEATRSGACGYQPPVEEDRSAYAYYRRKR